MNSIFVISVLCVFGASGLPQLNVTQPALQLNNNLLSPVPAPPTLPPTQNLLAGTNLLSSPVLQTINFEPNQNLDPNAHACTCGVFMSGQFTKGSNDQPIGYPALINEIPQAYSCNPAGLKTCVNKCLEAIIKHLPNSENIICGTAGRDCHKERAHLFVQNCEPVWINSNLSAGREYCCKDNAPYKCPLI